MTHFVYIATSRDGFIARKDGDISWLEKVTPISGEDYGYAQFMQKIDCIIMGRKTFEKVLTFDTWPYTKPVFVLSRTLTKTPKELRGKVTLLKGSPKEVLSFLEKKGYKNKYIDGANTIQQFLTEDLIDEMIITTIPITLGEGIALFKNKKSLATFNQASSKTYANGIQQNVYQRKK